MPDRSPPTGHARPASAHRRGRRSMGSRPLRGGRSAPSLPAVCGRATSPHRRPLLRPAPCARPVYACLAAHRLHRPLRHLEGAVPAVRADALVYRSRSYVVALAPPLRPCCSWPRRQRTNPGSLEDLASRPRARGARRSRRSYYSGRPARVGLCYLAIAGLFRRHGVGGICSAASTACRAASRSSRDSSIPAGAMRYACWQAFGAGSTHGDGQRCRGQERAQG